MFPLLIFFRTNKPNLCDNESANCYVVFTSSHHSANPLPWALYADFILLKLYLSESYCTLLCLDVASSRYILWQGNSGVTWFFPLTL